MVPVELSTMTVKDLRMVKLRLAMRPPLLIQFFARAPRPRFGSAGEKLLIPDPRRRCAAVRRPAFVVLAKHCFALPARSLF
jgi:hypothetical protein